MGIKERTETSKSMVNRNIWSDIRSLMEGDSLSVCAQAALDLYADAVSRGLLTYHLPVWDFVLDNAANAWGLKPEIRNTGESKGAERAPVNLDAANTIRSWLPMIRRAWRQRFGAGSAILHLRRVGGSYSVEVLCSDQVTAEAHPDYPADWSRALKVVITQEKGDIEYTRLPTGQYSGAVMTGQGSARKIVADLGTFAACPVTAWTRHPSSRLVPVADTALRDLHVSTAMQLTTAEFHRTFRLNQPIIYGATNKDAKQLQMGPDLIWRLSDGAKAEVLTSVDISESSLRYVIGLLKLGTRMMGIPPEIWDLTSRSETGAARSWDQRPLLLLEERDRTDAAIAMSDMLFQWLPILGPSFAGVEVVPVEPKAPMPVDLLNWANGAVAAMRLGQTTPAILYADAKQIPLTKAQAQIETNLAFSKPWLDAWDAAQKGGSFGGGQA